MKKNLVKFLLVLIILSVGWIAGYLKIPYFDSTNDFWIGFAVCLLFFAVGYILFRIRSSNQDLVKWFNSDKDKVQPAVRNPAKQYKSIWRLTAVLIFTGCVILALFSFHQSNSMNARALKLEHKLTELQEVSDALTKKHKVDLMANVLNLVDNEQRLNPAGPLSESTIARIAAYSFSLKPYKYFIDDSLSDKLLSPERGQLLIALTLMNLDSVSFKNIKKVVDFSYSDLRHSNFREKDLSGINLEYADLSHSELTGINLDSGRLYRITMTGAILNRASICNANIRSSFMQWVQMSNVQMKFTDASGADMSYSQFQESDLSGSKFDFSVISKVKLVNATLINTDFARANLTQSDLSHSNLTYGRLIKANVFGSDFDSTSLNEVEVSFQWIEINKNIRGHEYLKQNYHVVEEKTNNMSNSKFFLKRNNRTN